MDDLLQQRVHTTKTLLKKVQLACQNAREEMARLQDTKVKAVLALRRCRTPLAIAEVRVSHRTRKPELEFVEDDVEKALATESVDLAHYVDGIVSRVAQIDAHLEKMGACVQSLSDDAHDKQTAVRLDRDCMQHLASQDVHYEQSASPASHSLSIRETIKSSRLPVQAWEGCSNNLVRDAGTLVATSAQMRKQVETYLSHVYITKGADSARTKKSFEAKIHQTKKLQSKLSSEIKAIDSELLKLEGERDTVLQGLESSRGPMEQCKIRLNIRRSRPTRELVRDGVEIALQQQLGNLQNSVTSLESRLNAIENQQQALIDARSRLERDLQSKTASGYVDKECLDCAGSDFASIMRKKEKASSITENTSTMGSSIVSVHQRALRILTRARSSMK